MEDPSATDFFVVDLLPSENLVLLDMGSGNFGTGETFDPLLLSFANEPVGSSLRFTALVGQIVGAEATFVPEPSGLALTSVLLAVGLVVLTRGRSLPSVRG